MIPRKDVEKIKQVATEMSELTGLYIEDNFYTKFVLRDVNNYLAVYEDSTSEKEHVKLKGDFEVDKEYHKDSSMRIIRLAVKNYFVNGIKIEDTIKNHTNIYDFCLRLKLNSTTKGIFRHFDKNMQIVDEDLSRTTRYYIGHGLSSGALLKDFGDGRISGVNVGYQAILFNKFEKKEMKDYNINYSFYISEAYKLKNAVFTGQLSLF